MICVSFHEPTDQEWRDWLEEAHQEAQSLLKAEIERPASLIKERLYKAPRRYFLDAFHDKCAYCELKLPPGQRLGDVEHYRPKGRVMKADGTPVMITDQAGERPHPGYYWLAYDWRNLLPSCSACNRPGTDLTGYSSGKWDKFPVEDDEWATTPDEVESERPVLLNPWFDDPNEHLVFDDETGIIGFRTERGDLNIKILGLNRDGLPEKRRKAYTAARRAFAGWVRNLAEGNERTAADFLQDLQEIFDGSAEWSAFARSAVARARADFQLGYQRIESEGDN